MKRPIVLGQSFWRNTHQYFLSKGWRGCVRKPWKSSKSWKWGPQVFYRWNFVSDFASQCSCGRYHLTHRNCLTFAQHLATSPGNQEKLQEALKILIWGIFWSNETRVSGWENLEIRWIPGAEAWRFRRNFLLGSSGSWPLAHPVATGCVDVPGCWAVRRGCGTSSPIARDRFG